MGTNFTEEKVSDDHEWENWRYKLDTRTGLGSRGRGHMNMGGITAWEGVSLLLEVWWGQNIAVGIERRGPQLAPQLEFLHLLQFSHGSHNHLVLSVHVHKDRGSADEGQEAVRAHPGGRRNGRLCSRETVGIGVGQPAPDIAVIGYVWPGGEGGRQTPHIEPCVKAPGVLGCILPRIECLVTNLRLHLCVWWLLQGQLVVRLQGEAWQVSGLSGEEELTLSPSLVGGEGFSGMDHLGRHKREPRRAMSAEQDAAEVPCSPSQAQAASLQPRTHQDADDLHKEASLHSRCHQVCVHTHAYV